MHDAREYDLVLIGATGFTGSLVASDLAAQVGDGLRWAIAGRDRAKLEVLARRLGEPSPAGALPALEVVDVHDRVGLTALARRARVVATTVGPYARHGHEVVAACVAAGTDYVDITGEPAFVNRILREHDRAGRDAGIRIVNCCGFDSVPHDLGAQLAVEQLPAGAPITLRGFVSAGGRLSGGTIASASEAMADRASLRPPPLEPGRGRRVRALPRRVSAEPRIDGWAVPLPTIDPQVVLRSAAALEEYGPDFRYGHYARAANLPAALGLVGGVGAVAAVAQLRRGRRLLARLAPAPGEGPDETARRKGWFRVVLLGESPGARTRVEVRGGDPGYTETAKMLSEAARCLAGDRDRLPDRAGVLTTATAFGPLLRRRLHARGITFTVHEAVGGDEASGRGGDG